MATHKSLIGNKYGKLKVVKLSHRDKLNNGKSILVWECICECELVVYVPTSRLTRSYGGTKSCGKCQRADTFSKMTGSNNPAWKGGRFVDDSGYVQVWAPNHPNAKAIGYIREHRLVMSEVLGRYLVVGENVHHINGDKTDNRPENLELWNTSQPAGQRIEDKVKWAKEIIALYDKE